VCVDVKRSQSNGKSAAAELFGGDNIITEIHAKRPQLNFKWPKALPLGMALREDVSHSNALWPDLDPGKT
jgi:hypothetical protein